MHTRLTSDYGTLVPGSKQYNQAVNARTEMLHHLSERDYRGVNNPHIIARLQRVKGRVKAPPHLAKSMKPDRLERVMAELRGAERRMWRGVLKFANRPKARPFLGKRLAALAEAAE